MSVDGAILLRVNLTTKTITKEPLADDVLRRYLGGRTLGAHILLGELDKGIDPLGPDNKLLVMGGPLNGSNVAGSGRFAVMAKSPLTGFIGEAFAGGHFIHELRWAGYLGIIVEGRSESPVYLRIHDDEVELCDASHLWGEPPLEVEHTLHRELDDGEYKILTIGLAGEKLAKIACIINDVERAAGRTGLGAVMGSKNLKAVAVRGTRGIRPVKPERIAELSMEYNRKARDFGMGVGLKVQGTPGLVKMLNTMGVLPTRNFQEGEFEGVEGISGDVMWDKYLVRKKACAGCSIACINQVRVQGGPFGEVEPVYGGPEYETLAAFGSLLGIDNYEAVAAANKKCNSYGLDTIATGTVIAFATECYLNGLITEEEVGFPLSWNDPRAMLKLIDMIAAREGFGDRLAEGSTRLAEHIPGDPQRFLIATKGQDWPMHDPRGKMGLGIQYATASKGATHCDGFHDHAYIAPDGAPELGIPGGMKRTGLEGKGPYIVLAEDWRTVVNSAVVCYFTMRESGPVRNVEEFTELLAAITGFDYDIAELMKVGARGQTLTRAFSCREGVSRKDDTLPPRLFEPLPEGGTKGSAYTQKEFQACLDAYYQARGYTDDGIPTAEVCAQLDIPEVAEKLR